MFIIGIGTGEDREAMVGRKAWGPPPSPHMNGQNYT